MRLLLVQAGTGAFGASERVVWELATRLPDSRYAIQVWLDSDPDLDELAESLGERGVAVGRISEPRSAADLRGQLGVWKALRRTRPTLIHLHAGAPAAHRRLPRLARLAGVPHLVASRHGIPEGEPWRELRAADAVTVACASVAESLARGHGIDRERLRVVANGADPPDEVSELPAARRLRDRFAPGIFRPLWVCAARLEQVKGHDVLLEALGRLEQRGLDFVAAWAGDGSRRAALERLAGEMGLGTRVHFLGPVDSLGPLLLAADAVVLPSRDEAMPLSLLEALARARAVVASAVGGVPEVIEDGVHGRLVAPGDPEALAQALAGLHQKPDTGRQMGMRGAERVRASLTWAHAVGRFEAVYDEVLGLAGFTPEGDPRGRVAAPGRTRS